MESVERPVLLLVDDTPVNLLLLTRMLEKDYTINAARNGQEALDSAFANPPDLILLDVMMPDMDGFEVCRRLKDVPATTHIPVIFITAKNAVEDEERGFALGAADFIHKPISPPIVAARVKTHLKIKFMQDYLLYENSLLHKDVQRQSMELEHIRDFIQSLQNSHR
jgi:putative two-component system response regulator